MKTPPYVVRKIKVEDKTYMIKIEIEIVIKFFISYLLFSFLIL
jgi:hypothetical protein